MKAIVEYAPGFDLYGIGWNKSTNQIYDADDKRWEDVGSWDVNRRNGCAVPWSDFGGGCYAISDLPDGILSTDDWLFIIYRQLGSSPAENDKVLEQINNENKIDYISKLAECDVKIDKTGTPWLIVKLEKGTDTEILRKQLKDPDGTNIAASGVVVGQHIHTASP